VLLADLLVEGRVKVPLTGGTKDEILAELVELVAADMGPGVASPILAAVHDREREMTTGFGGGIAIPHGRTPAVDGLGVAAGVTRHPIDYDAVDGEPVRIVFLLVGPETAAGEHVRTLARIARLVRRPEVRNALLDAESVGDFVRVIRQAEAA
jgi:mannitol/fructose-specific phosphotransferase system IIA component (Ntr-type)